MMYNKKHDLRKLCLQFTLLPTDFLSFASFLSFLFDFDSVPATWYSSQQNQQRVARKHTITGKTPTFILHCPNSCNFYNNDYQLPLQKYTLLILNIQTLFIPHRLGSKLATAITLASCPICAKRNAMYALFYTAIDIIGAQNIRQVK